MNFTIHFGKIKCELSLTEKEAATSRRCVYRYLKHLSKESMSIESNTGGGGGSVYDRNMITSLQLGQYMDIEAIVAALEDHKHHMIQAAPLWMIVELINNKNLLPTNGEKFNFDTFVYEIFDQTFRDYVILINPDLPILAGADVRIKNSLNIFSYKSQSSSASTLPTGSSGSSNCDKGFKVRPQIRSTMMDKAEVERIGKLLDSLANDRFYRQLDVAGKAQANLEYLWCLVTSVDDRQQQRPTRLLCHQHVCRNYVAALQNNRMFYKACIDYPQFNLVHSKIMQITERMMRSSIPLNLSLCGLEQAECRTSMADIRAARLAFKQRQRQID